MAVALDVMYLAPPSEPFDPFAAGAPGSFRGQYKVAIRSYPEGLVLRIRCALSAEYCSMAHAVRIETKLQMAGTRSIPRVTSLTSPGSGENTHALPPSESQF